MMRAPDGSRDRSHRRRSLAVSAL